MRAEFESPEQMDLSQPSGDFALKRNLEQFKPRIKPLARVGLAITLAFGAAGAGAVSGIGSGDKISKELNSTATRIPLATDVPTVCTLPTPTVEVLSAPPIVVIEGVGPVPLCGDGEPACPPDQVCKITSFECAPGVNCMSGVCVDSDAGQ